jgi:TRAP-type C4-dicarboxylate transport system permease small subunit
MDGFLAAVGLTARFLNVFAGVALTSMMGLTCADVVLRYLGHPILGTYEMVCLLGGVVLACGFPLTSWKRGHTRVALLLSHLSEKKRITIQVATRCIAILLFLMAGRYLIQYGMNLKKAGEVTAILHIRLYPVPWLIGVCCFIQCLVLICDFVKIFRRQYDAEDDSVAADEKEALEGI